MAGGDGQRERDGVRHGGKKNGAINERLGLLYKAATIAQRGSKSEHAVIG